MLFSTLSKVMTSGFNTEAFKYFSWKSARDHPGYPRGQWLGNSSGSCGVTLFLCFWFREEIQPGAGRISSNPVVTNSIAYQTSTWRRGISSSNDNDEISKLLFLWGLQKSYSSWSIATRLQEAVGKGSCSLIIDQETRCQMLVTCFLESIDSGS